MTESALAQGEPSGVVTKSEFARLTPWLEDAGEVGADHGIDDWAQEKLAHRRESALALAESLVADAVRLALVEDGRTLREIQRATGLDPGGLSRLAKGKNCEVASLAFVALALGKTLNISLEPLPEDD